MTPKSKLRSRLEVNRLESRETPSVTVSSSGNNLNITDSASGPIDNRIDVVQTPNTNMYAVLVNGTPVGTFTANSMSISMGGGNDTVSLNFDGGLKDKLTVDMGAGNDSFTTKNSTGGAIGGKTTVSTGASPATAPGNYDDVVELYNLTFKGPVDVSGSAGSAADQLDILNAKFNDPVTATNFYAVDLGQPGAASGAAIFKSNLTIDNSKLNTDSRVGLPSGNGNVVFGFSGLKIDGNFTYLGGSGRDDVDLPSDPVSVADVTIGGNLTVKSGDGVNTLALGNGQNGTHVGGNVEFAGGSGIDRFFFDSDSSVDGNVSVKLNGGNNQLFGDSTAMGGGPFNPTGSATVGGHLKAELGNGNNFIGTYGAGASLTVEKSLTIKVGDGINLGGDATSPGAITLFNQNLSVGDTASYEAGKGSQDINITNNGSTLPKLKITFEGGTRSVRFTGPAETFSGDATIDFGKGPGMKFYDPPAAPTGKVVVKNYP